MTELLEDNKPLTRLERLEHDHAVWEVRTAEYERAKASIAPLSDNAERLRLAAYTASKAAQRAYNAKLTNPGDRRLVAAYEAAREAKETTASEAAAARAEFERAHDTIQAGAKLTSQEPPVCDACHTRMDRDLWLRGYPMHPSCN
jgi:hypothetical protein